MKHIQHIKSAGAALPETFIIKATGQYYTDLRVAHQMAESAVTAWTSRHCAEARTIRIIDPFAGDGRLVVEFIRAWRRDNGADVKWDVTLWDLNEEGLVRAASTVNALRCSDGLDLELHVAVGDAFHLAISNIGKFDITISNPPWELLKPDRRELELLSKELAASYVDSMRQYDRYLAELFPRSQPTRKFAGWGTNLSRVGYEVCRAVLKSDGILAIVMPATFMADDLSVELRRDVLETCTIHEIAYFPAEARLFDSADVATITLIVAPGKDESVVPLLTRYDKDLQIESQCHLDLGHAFLERSNYVVPIFVGNNALKVLTRLSNEFPTWSNLERRAQDGLWAGREIDETRSTEWLRDDVSGPRFVKGRMIDRFRMLEVTDKRIQKAGWTPPASSSFTRIAWRDVSRPNQKRRLIATIIPAGFVAGNSLGVAYFRDGHEVALRVLLGVMSSLVFEFQLRCYLATGHVSLSSLRKVTIPNREQLQKLADVEKEVSAILADPHRSQASLEALIAVRVYGLCQDEFASIVNSFPKLTAVEKTEILVAFQALTDRGVRNQTSAVVAKSLGQVDSALVSIPNHHSARLSSLDMSMVRAVPQGGNWKDIPQSLPSKRLEQIRESFSRGEGSRSTYYGRLRPECPSYTINTYFNRPGNGCHIHPDQDRVISQREAARLQSFPDSFHFCGPQGSVNKQIGNAVPPLLAFQIARQIGKPAMFVDLFSGAGGMGLGFKWAGWQPIVANDIEFHFLETYRQNVHSEVILGSIADAGVRTQIADCVSQARKQFPQAEIWVLGGPPCQGFSTAGHQRSMADERNHLFEDYCAVLEALAPDGFVFENVTGLLNMQGGKVFDLIKKAFRAVMPRVDGWLLSAEEFGVPQRRKRVLLVGNRNSTQSISPPKRITSCSTDVNLFDAPKPAVSVMEALYDLPPLTAGEDGSHLVYQRPPQTTYQALMRGYITPDDFLDSIRHSARAYTADE